jgi:hypothetical protein
VLRSSKRALVCAAESLLPVSMLSLCIFTKDSYYDYCCCCCCCRRCCCCVAAGRPAGQSLRGRLVQCGAAVWQRLPRSAANSSVQDEAMAPQCQPQRLAGVPRARLLIPGKRTIQYVGRLQHHMCAGGPADSAGITQPPQCIEPRVCRADGHSAKGV